jgi:hypothetical protein
MDAKNKVVVAPGFIFSLWQLTRPRTAVVETEATESPVLLMVVDGGLADAPMLELDRAA